MPTYNDYKDDAIKGSELKTLLTSVAKKLKECSPEVIAAALVDLDSRLSSLEYDGQNLGDVVADSVDSQVLKIGGEDVSGMIDSVLKSTAACSIFDVGASSPAYLDSSYKLPDNVICNNVPYYPQNVRYIGLSQFVLGRTHRFDLRIANCGTTSLYNDLGVGVNFFWPRYPTVIDYLAPGESFILDRHEDNYREDACSAWLTLLDGGCLYVTFGY